MCRASNWRRRRRRCLARLRAKPPRVHCITNSVAQNFTANVLLALGAVPSMTLSAEEIGAFVARSRRAAGQSRHFRPRAPRGDRHRRRRGRARRAALGARSGFRRPRRTARRLCPRPDGAGAEGGAAQRRRIHRAFRAASRRATRSRLYARERGTVIGLSGATDLIADGARIASIANGHPLMARVTAMGCAASSIVAACLAVEQDALVATVVRAADRRRRRRNGGGERQRARQLRRRHSRRALHHRCARRSPTARACPQQVT